jgi:hypothetical protein
MLMKMALLSVWLVSLWLTGASNMTAVELNDVAPLPLAKSIIAPVRISVLLLFMVELFILSLLGICVFLPLFPEAVRRCKAQDF